MSWEMTTFTIGDFHGTFDELLDLTDDERVALSVPEVLRIGSNCNGGPERNMSHEELMQTPSDALRMNITQILFLADGQTLVSDQNRMARGDFWY